MSHKPIKSQGVHVPTWMSSEIGRLLERYLGPDWIDQHDNPALCDRVMQIPDEELWAARQTLRAFLFNFVRERARQRWTTTGAANRVVAAGTMFDKDTLTIGFARRFTSYERIDEIPYMVIKKDGTRERFDRQKLISGLLKACEKRPVSVAALEGVADAVEATLQERPEKEMSTHEVGGIVMDHLRQLDKVAYVRFASVYRHFRDIGEFMSELKDLLNAKE